MKCIFRNLNQTPFSGNLEHRFVGGNLTLHPFHASLSASYCTFWVVDIVHSCPFSPLSAHPVRGGGEKMLLLRCGLLHPFFLSFQAARMGGRREEEPSKKSFVPLFSPLLLFVVCVGFCLSPSFSRSPPPSLPLTLSPPQVGRREKLCPRPENFCHRQIWWPRRCLAASLLHWHRLQGCLGCVCGQMQKSLMKCGCVHLYVR